MNEDLFTTVGAANAQPEVTSKFALSWKVVEEIEQLPKKDKNLLGRVYAIEFSDGTVKIGSSSLLQNRIRNIHIFTGKYGNNALKKIAYTEQPHIEYVENEKYLHQFFDAQQIKERGRELFAVKLEDVLSVPIFGSDGVEERERRSELAAEACKQIVLHGACNDIKLRERFRMMLTNPEDGIMLYAAEIEKLEKRIECYMKAIGVLYEFMDKQDEYLEYFNDNNFIDSVLKKAVHEFQK